MIEVVLVGVKSMNMKTALIQLAPIKQRKMIAMLFQMAYQNTMASIGTNV